MAESLEEINAKISQIDALLAQEDYQPATQEQIQAQRYRAAGEVAMEYDPDQARQYFSMADDLEQRREEFDYRKAQDLLKVEAPNKKQTRELEQLWKDATRALTQARVTRDKSSVDYYTGLTQRLQEKLQTLRPEIWTEGQQAPTDEPAAAPESVDFAEIEEQVKSQAVDTNKDGNVDNMADIKASIRKWAVANGVPTDDPNYLDLFTFLDDKQKQFEKERQSRIKTQEIAQKRVDDSMKYDEKYKWLYQPYKNLLSNPNDTAAKNDALMAALRKESGAAIAADEFVNFMKLALTGENLRDFNDRTTDLKSVLLGMTDDNARDAYIKRIGYEYLDKADANKIAEKIASKIPDKYLEGKKKATTSSRSGKPKRGDFPTLTAWRKAVKEWQAGN